MSRITNIQLSLIEGQHGAYVRLLSALRKELPSGTLSTREEYIRDYNNFCAADFTPVTARFPELLVELDIRGDYEEDSCRCRLRGAQAEIIQKEYPRFDALLSSKERAARDILLFSRLNLEAADRAALDTLHARLQQPLAINSDLPGDELIVVFRTDDDNCFVVDVSRMEYHPQGGVRFEGIDPYTGFEVSATERHLVPGQAVLAAQRALRALP